MNRDRALRFTLAALLAAAVALPKTPVESGSICDRYQHSDLIFTGAAEHPWVTMVDTKKSPIHKKSEKSKRVRFLAREWFKGQRQETVEIWMPPSDCDVKYETGQNYLIYAHRNATNGRLETNACVDSVPVAAAVADISFLTAAQYGPVRTTRISGSAAAEGTSIKATSGIDTRYAIAGAGGAFTFDGLPAGDWELSVVGGGSKQLHLEPSSCPVVDLK